MSDVSRDQYLREGHCGCAECLARLAEITALRERDMRHQQQVADLEARLATLTATLAQREAEIITWRTGGHVHRGDESDVLHGVDVPTPETCPTCQREQLTEALQDMSQGAAPPPEGEESS